ncbi:hypothetical protein ACPA0F_18370 [Solibacillus silvestris]
MSVPTTKVARNALLKRLNSMFTPAELEDIAFYADKVDEQSYTFHMNVFGKYMCLKYDFTSKKVTIEHAV